MLYCTGEYPISVSLKRTRRADFPITERDSLWLYHCHSCMPELWSMLSVAYNHLPLINFPPLRFSLVIFCRKVLFHLHYRPKWEPGCFLSFLKSFWNSSAAFSCVDLPSNLLICWFCCYCHLTDGMSSFAESQPNVLVLKIALSVILFKAIDFSFRIVPLTEKLKPKYIA